jgi:hypothetical protein
LKNALCAMSRNFFVSWALCKPFFAICSLCQGLTNMFYKIFCQTNGLAGLVKRFFYFQNFRRKSLKRTASHSRIYYFRLEIRLSNGSIGCTKLLASLVSTRFARVALSLRLLRKRVKNRTFSGLYVLVRNFPKNNFSNFFQHKSCCARQGGSESEKKIPNVKFHILTKFKHKSSN